MVNISCTNTWKFWRENKNGSNGITHTISMEKGSLTIC